MHSLASQAPPRISTEDRREPAANFKEVVFAPRIRHIGHHFRSSFLILCRWTNRIQRPAGPCLSECHLGCWDSFIIRDRGKKPSTFWTRILQEASMIIAKIMNAIPPFPRPDTTFQRGKRPLSSSEFNPWTRHSWEIVSRHARSPI